MQNKSVLMLTYTHARRPEESFIFVRTHGHYHCHYIFFSFAWLVGCLLRFKKRVKIRKGANCYLYYSVKSSKPRGSTRYRRIPREPKQRKCNTHCVWGTGNFLDFKENKNGFDEFKGFNNETCVISLRINSHND